MNECNLRIILFDVVQDMMMVTMVVEIDKRQQKMNSLEVEETQVCFTFFCFRYSF